MSELFINVVNMSISASWFVLAVLMLRLLMKKAPKWINVLLWGVVAVRLVCPFSFESALSLIPSSQTINPEIAINQPVIDSGVTVIDKAINPIISEAAVSFQPEKDVNLFQFVLPYFAGVWLLGIAFMLIYTLVSFLRLKRKIDTAVLLCDNIYQSETIASPFVLGVIRPKIYLPFNIDSKDLNHVVAHENAHIHRKDYLWKPVGFLILTLHWFNPLMWLGYVLLCRDIELACDEKVVKELDREGRADYSQALLSCSVSRRMIAACPLAFGEVGVKQRIKSVLNYRKPAFWVIIVSVIVSVVVTICFMTNPETGISASVGSEKSGSDLKGVSLRIASVDFSAPDPYIELEWVNETSEQLLFGEEFHIFYEENGNWENCSINEDTVWHLIGYIVKPYSTSVKSYKLNGQIMTQLGKYRIEAPFSVDGKSDKKLNVWIEFELKAAVVGIDVHTLKPVELVYDDGMHSFVQSAEGAPTYMIVNSMQLFINADGNISGLVGAFEEITMNEDNFDSRFKGNTDYSWMGDDTLESLKKNNKRIWQLYTDENTETPHLYILLEQKDGTFYMGYGYYNCNTVNPVNPDDSYIRWLYKLRETDAYDVSDAYWSYQPYAGAIFWHETEYILPDGYEIISAKATEGSAWIDDGYYNTDGSKSVKWSPGFYEDGTATKETDLTIKATKDGKNIEFRVKITDDYENNNESDIALKTYKITPVNCKMREVTAATYYLEEK